MATTCELHSVTQAREGKRRRLAVTLCLISEFSHYANKIIHSVEVTRGLATHFFNFKSFSQRSFSADTGGSPPHTLGTCYIEYILTCTVANNLALASPTLLTDTKTV